MSPEMARHRAALRLAFAATLALVWGAMTGEPLPGLTAVLAAQILVGMPRPPRLGQAAALVAVIAATGGAAFAVAMTFADRPLILTAALGLAILPRFCDARTGGGPAIAPRDHAAERHRGGPGPHGPSGHPGGRRAADPRHRGGTGDARRLAPLRALPGTARRDRHRPASCRQPLPQACRWNTVARRVSSPRSPSCCQHNSSISPSPQRSPFRHCSVLSPSCPRRIPRPGAPNS